jgi:hypothetical protein
MVGNVPVTLIMNRRPAHGCWTHLQSNSGLSSTLHFRGSRMYFSAKHQIDLSNNVTELRCRACISCITGQFQFRLFSPSRALHASSCCQSYYSLGEWQP